MRQRIKNIYELKLTCKDCTWDGAPHRLQVALASGYRTLNTGMEVRLTSKAESKRLGGTAKERQPGQPAAGSAKTEPQKEGKKEETAKQESTDKESSSEGWLYLGIGSGIFLTVIILVLVARRGRRARSRITDEDLPGARDNQPQMVPTIDLDVAKEVVAARELPMVAVPLPGSGKQLKFTVIRGGLQKPLQVELFDRLVIGRSSDCDIVLDNDKEVSRAHCELSLDQGLIHLTDLGSKNGTLVNGIPITGRYKLKNDDILLIGRTELRLNIS